MLKIVLGDDYSTNDQACQAMGIETLENRRMKLSLSFALKCCDSKKFEHLFLKNSENKHEKFAVPFAHTSRYQNSPKVALTRLLNEHYKHTKKGS